MPTAMEQRLLRELKADAHGREPGRKADAFTAKQDMEALEEGKDLAPEAAQRVQNRMGNQALNNIMNRNNAAPEAMGASVEMEEEEAQETEQEEELDKGEEEGAEHEETQRQFGGTGGAGGAGGAGDPWDLDHFFGGDDDPDGAGKPTRRRRLRPSAIRNFPGMGAQDLLPQKSKDALDDGDLDAIERALGPLGAATPDRWGDAVYQAVDAAFADPRRLGRRTVIEPEDLIDSTGVLDPIGRPAEVGRFLGEAGDGLLSRSLARVLGGPSASLLPPATGHSGAAARLASLAVCCEALEGGGVTTDRAVAVALRRDAWPTAWEVAAKVHATGPLRAPLLLSTLLGAEAGEEVRLTDPLDTTPIGGRAVGRIIPEARLPVVPELELTGEAPPELDPEIAEIDALLNSMTGAAALNDPPDPNLSMGEVGPVLEAATGLVNALSRAQVELAAAALAVRRVHPKAPVRAVLVKADEALVQLARATVGAGRGLEKLIGQPRETSESNAIAFVNQMREVSSALGALRVWAFSSLGGAVAA